MAVVKNREVRLLQIFDRLPIGIANRHIYLNNARLRAQNNTRVFLGAESHNQHGEDYRAKALHGF
jgi:hypothetical protein